MILSAALMLTGSAGLVSAQFGSTMDITENGSNSVPYDSGDEVKLDLELEMQNVDRYSTKIDYDKDYLEFEDISGDHDVWWDQGSGDLIYVGGRATNSTGGDIDNATSTLQLTVKEDIPKDGVINTSIDVVEPQATVSGDRVTDIFGQETRIAVDTGEREKQFDVDLEMDGNLQVTKGESQTIRSYATNRGDRLTDLRLELLVDKNRDGVIAINEVVSEKNVTLQEQEKLFESEYENINLPEGDYEFYTRLVRDREVERSFTNSTLTVLQEKNTGTNETDDNDTQPASSSLSLQQKVDDFQDALYTVEVVATEVPSDYLVVSPGGSATIENVDYDGSEPSDSLETPVNGSVLVSSGDRVVLSNADAGDTISMYDVEGDNYSLTTQYEVQGTLGDDDGTDDDDEAQENQSISVGLEMEGDIRVDRGNSKVIESSANNRAGGTIEDLELELLVDTNQNNRFESGEVVSNKDVELRGGQDSFEIEYNDINLSEGEYEFYTRLVKGDKVQRSYTNSTLTVTEEVDVREVDVNIPDRAVDVNKTVTVPLEVEEGNVSEYVATIKYNSDIVEFVSADGREFDRQEVAVQSGYLTISGSTDRDYISPEVAQLEFKGLVEGTSDIEIVESDTRFSSSSESETETEYRDGQVEVLPGEDTDNQTYLEVNMSVVGNRNGTVRFSSAIESSADVETVTWDPKTRDSGDEVVRNYDGFGTSKFVHNYSESGLHIAEFEVTTVNGEKDSDEVVVRTNVTEKDESVKVVETDLETQRDELTFGENVTLEIGADVGVEESGLNLSLGYENTYMEFAGVEESSLGEDLDVSLNREEELTYVNLRYDESVELNTEQVAQVRFETSDPNPDLQLDSVATFRIEQQVLDRSENVKTTGDRERILISDKDQDENTKDSNEDRGTNKTDDGQDFNETVDEPDTGINGTDRNETDSGPDFNQTVDEPNTGTNGTDDNQGFNETTDETDENTGINETDDGIGGGIDTGTNNGTDNDQGNESDEQQGGQSIIDSIASIIGFGGNGESNDSADQEVSDDQNNVTNGNQTGTDQGNIGQNNDTGTNDSGEDQGIFGIFTGLFG